jgi:hypothetical protein
MANVFNLGTQVTNLGDTVFYLTLDAPTPPPGPPLAAVLLQQGLMAFRAPTTGNTTIVAVTAAASAQQVVSPAGGIRQHVVNISCDQSFLILFGLVGAVPTPSAANAVLLAGNVLYQIRCSAESTAFRVVRLATDGTLSWTLES